MSGPVGSLVSVAVCRAVVLVVVVCGSVAVMIARRTAFLALAVLVTSGCVKVPYAPLPHEPVARPGHLAPAAVRSPSPLQAPLPAWPEPAPAAPREELAAVPARPVEAVQREERRPAAEPPPVPASAAPSAASKVPPRGRAVASPRRPAGPGAVRQRPSKPASRKAVPRVSASAKPRPAKRSQRQVPAPVRREQQRQAANGQAPEMRELCRAAGRIDAPMGAADLCRNAYGS